MQIEYKFLQKQEIFCLKLLVKKKSLLLKKTLHVTLKSKISLKSAVFFNKILPELLQISRWKVQIYFYFYSFLLSQTYFFGKCFSLCFCSTVMLKFHVQIQRNIRAIISSTFLKWTFITFLYHVRCSSYFLFGFLDPKLIPLFLSLLKF